VFVDISANNVIFLFFGAHSLVIRNIVYWICSYHMFSKNILASNHADGFCFLSEDVSRQL